MPNDSAPGFKGRNLALARIASNLTQRQLADKLGLPQSSIARWESGSRKPNSQNIEMLAAFFRRSPSFFF